MLGEQRAVCSGSDSAPQPHSVHVGSVSSGATQAMKALGRVPGGLPETGRAAGEGKSLSEGERGWGVTYRNRLGLGPGERKCAEGGSPPHTQQTHQGLHDISVRHEEGQEETLTRMWITCSGSSPSTATPFTSTSLSPAYNKPRQPGTQNEEGVRDIGTERGTCPRAL